MWIHSLDVFNYFLMKMCQYGYRGIFVLYYLVYRRPTARGSTRWSTTHARCRTSTARGWLRRRGLAWPPRRRQSSGGYSTTRWVSFILIDFSVSVPDWVPCFCEAWPNSTNTLRYLYPYFDWSSNIDKCFYEAWTNSANTWTLREIRMVFFIFFIIHFLKTWGLWSSRIVPFIKLNWRRRRR